MLHGLCFGLDTRIIIHCYVYFVGRYVDVLVTCLCWFVYDIFKEQSPTNSYPYASGALVPALGRISEFAIFSSSARPHSCHHAQFNMG